MIKTCSKIAILVLVLLLCLVSMPSCSSSPPPDVIQLDGFEVALSEPEIDFPDSITFNVEVESDTEISGITLNYRVDRTSTFLVTGVGFPEFEPDTAVKTSWTLNTLRSGGLPPGAGIEYWWSIEDTQGNKAQTSPAEVSFDDKGHSWNSLVNGQTTIYWYDGAMSFASSLMSAAQQAIVRLANDTGVGLEEEVKIYIYASSQDLREALIYPQDWTGGVAFTEFSTIAIGISPGNLTWGRGAISHELCHLMVHHFISNGFGVELPTWLDEGLAMYAQGGLSSDFSSILNRAISDDDLISVKSLSSSFPTQGDAARLAYAQSYYMVEYLLEEQGGQNRMLELLEAFNEGNGYVDALNMVYGLDIEQLDTLCHEYILERLTGESG